MISLDQAARLLSTISAPFLERILKALAFNKKINQLLDKQETKRIRKIDELKRILIIPDINIGDAIISQSFLIPLKNSFPNIEISYTYQRKAYPLIKANPKIDRHFPLFRSFGDPSKRDCRILNNLIEKYDFDLIFNFCPYFHSKNFKSTNSPVIYPIKYISNIIRAYNSSNHKAHIVFQSNKFAKELIRKFPIDPNPKTIERKKIPDNPLFLTEQVCKKTIQIMDKSKINPLAKKILYNPDTSSQYTFIPFKFQRELLKGIVSCRELDLLLLNSGRTFKGIEKKLLKEIPSIFRRKIVVLSRSIDVDVFAALIDNSDMFISGDTGPLHIAAAKKLIVNSDNQFKNSTAIVGIFGATSSKIYGYDSFSDEYLSASQDVPSKIFEGTPACKNIICIDKTFKNCPEVRCFDGLESELVIDYVQNYLS